MGLIIDGSVSELRGSVYNKHRASDLTGTYKALQASAAFGSGGNTNISDTIISDLKSGALSVLPTSDRTVWTPAQTEEPYWFRDVVGAKIHINDLSIELFFEDVYFYFGYLPQLNNTIGLADVIDGNWNVIFKEWK